MPNAPKRIKKPATTRTKQRLAKQAQLLGFSSPGELHEYLTDRDIAISERTISRYWKDPTRFPSEPISAAIFRGLGWRLSDWVDEENLETNSRQAV